MIDTEQLLKANFNREIKKLQEMYDERTRAFLSVSKENSRLRDEHFKDRELAKIKAENERLREISPFPEKFMNKVHDHCKECNIRSIYGNFEIALTHIATFYKWTCPVCKKEIEEYW